MTAGRLALLASVTASAVSGLLMILIHVAGADPRMVWTSFIASLASQLGVLLSLVLVALVGILFAFALGWIAIKLFGILAIEAVRIVTRPAVDAAQAVRDAGGAAVRVGGTLAQGAVDGVAAAGNAAVGLMQRGAQYVPGMRTDGASAPEGVGTDAKR